MFHPGRSSIQELKFIRRIPAAGLVVSIFTTRVHRGEEYHARTIRFKSRWIASFVSPAGFTRRKVLVSRGRRLATEVPISDPSSRNDGDLEKRGDRVHPRERLPLSFLDSKKLPYSSHVSRHVFRIGLRVRSCSFVKSDLTLKLRVRGTESSMTAEEHDHVTAISLRLSCQTDYLNGRYFLAVFARFGGKRGGWRFWRGRT